jgi:ATPase subunit of ABC transporter with duplicated ATPase domains
MVALCPQTVEALGPEIERFARVLDGAAARLQGLLALDAAQLAHWDSLSPGERKRWQIAAALHAEPDALLLDEPTNHLDADARGRLLQALAGFRGIGLVVSHDRAVLDALAHAVLRFDEGTARLWTGSWSQARVVWEKDLLARVDARERAQEEARRLARHLDERRREREAAQADRSARHRMRNRNDNDARGVVAQTRVKHAEAKLARRAAIARRRTEGAVEEIERVAVPKQLGRSV